MRDKESLITEYFNQGYSDLEILAFLLLHHSTVISHQTLTRRLQKLGLKRRIPQSSRDSENIVQNEVLAQLFVSGRSLGERFYILNYLVFFKLETLFKT